MPKTKTLDDLLNDLDKMKDKSSGKVSRKALTLEDVEGIICKN